MSVNRSVLLECDHQAPGFVCRVSFSYGTTNLRRTREAAEAEGWRTGFERDDPDYCPRHAAAHEPPPMPPAKPPMWS